MRAGGQAVPWCASADLKENARADAAEGARGRVRVPPAAEGGSPAWPRAGFRGLANGGKGTVSLRNTVLFLCK